MQMIHGVAALSILNYFYHHPVESIYVYELKHIAQNKWMAQAAVRLIHTPAPLFVPLLTRYFLGICRGKRCPALQPLHISLAFPHCTTTKQAKLGLVHPELRNVLSALTGFFLGGCKERQFTWPSCRGAEKIFDCGSWAECVFFKSDPEASVGSAYLRSV